MRLAFPFILIAGCAPVPEPIQDHNYIMDKYEIARPAVLAAVIGGWQPCPENTPRWPHGIYLDDPMPECYITSSDKPETPTGHPPPPKPPTSKPPTNKPPTSKPPTSEPPSERVRKNNGLGNGDQPAPGRSLANNRAENQVGNPGHKSGKAQNSD